jgi:hypothetical protein
MTGKLIAVGLLVLPVLFVVGAGILFGSSSGVLGDWVHWDLNLKTKILNTLAVFGYFTLGYLGFRQLKPTQDTSKVAIDVLLGAWVSVIMGYGSVDCVVFRFCN